MAYPAAAKKAGFDGDLVDRISAVAALEDAFGTELATELKSIAGEALRRCDATIEPKK